MKKITNIMIATCILFGLVGCQGPAKLIDSNEKHSESIWCNQRYLHKIDGQFDEIHLDVAKKTYIYALASSIAISNANNELIKRHLKLYSDNEITFSLPARMRQIDTFYDPNTGFSATTFLLYKEEGMDQPDELVIAFSGTNEIIDWWANLTPIGLKHYKKARLYFRNMVSKYGADNNLKVVVTGYSLGGGLSLHVLKNEKTMDQVKEAVIFNSSTKTYSWDVRPDPNLWAVSTDKEGLKLFRRFMRSLGASIAPDNQRAEGFNLVEKNLIEDHFNDVLTRSLLHVADYALITEGADETEPMKILKSTKHYKCAI